MANRDLESLMPEGSWVTYRGVFDETPMLCRIESVDNEDTVWPYFLRCLAPAWSREALVDFWAAIEDVEPTTPTAEEEAQWLIHTLSS